jgi:hypothetical protein
MPCHITDIVSAVVLVIHPYMHTDTHIYIFAIARRAHVDNRFLKHLRN